MSDGQAVWGGEGRKTREKVRARESVCACWKIDCFVEAQWTLFADERTFFIMSLAQICKRASVLWFFF